VHFAAKIQSRNWDTEFATSAPEGETILNGSAYTLDAFTPTAVKQSAPLQAWSGPEVSRKLMFPDFMTTAQDGGQVVSLYPLEIHPVHISVRG
jgi:hypothetical protein